MGLIGGQIRYETKESFDRNKTAKTKVKTWHFSEDETEREDERNERNYCMGWLTFCEQRLAQSYSSQYIGDSKVENNKPYRK